MIHVGMDLHHRMAYVRAITDDAELLEGRKIYFNDLPRLWEYLDQFGDQPVRVVFEAISNARWMYRLLRQRPNVEPVVVTPHKVKIIAETVSKTDKIDAAKLAWLSSVNMLPKAWMPDERFEVLRELVRHRSKLVRVRTRAKNEINGVLVRCGIQRPYDNIFGIRGRRWLTILELPKVMRLQVDNWLEQIDSVEAKLALLESRVRRTLKNDTQWSADAELLSSIPGVGLISVVTILAELGEYRRFRSRSQIAAYVGLVPTSKRSAKTARYGSLSKRGSPELRRVLTQVALGVSRQVPKYHWLYERIKQEKCANIAKSAIARHLIEDAWTLLMKREPFQLRQEPAATLTRAG